MKLEERNIEELTKEIKNLKEENASLRGMYEMTSLYLKEIRDNLTISEREARLANKNLMDSINYAKYIQDAFSIDQDHLNELIPNSLLFSRPKDVISGDFVWAYPSGDSVYLAIGDCTGHGVPGAMLTIFLISSLNQLSLKIKDETPAEILLRLDAALRLDLSKYTDKVKDSAELALMKYNATTQELVYAGAKRPLIIFRNNELFSYKGSRFVLGNPARSSQQIENRTIKLERGDMVYSFSDGFPDQFGGKYESKYSTKKLIQFLQSIKHLSIADQQERLSEELTQWMNDNQQIDDVLVAGFKV